LGPYFRPKPPPEGFWVEPRAFGPALGLLSFPFFFPFLLIFERKHLRREEISKAMVKIHSLSNNHFNLFKQLIKKVINQKTCDSHSCIHQTRYKYTPFH